MADNKTTVDTTTTTQAPEIKSVVDQVDYKAEYEKTQNQLKQAEHTIVKLKQEDKNSAVADPKVDVEAIKKELAQEIKQDNEQFKQGLVADVLEEELNHLTTNEDERKLIKLHYEKSIVKTGYSRAQIFADLGNARLLANKSLYEKQLNETRAALQSKDGRSAGSAASVKIDSASTTQVTLSAQERELIQRVASRRKISFEEALKIFKK